MVKSENSTAIDRVAATRSKSDEFSEFTILVIEIVSLLCLKPPKWCCTFWDPDSPGRFMGPYPVGGRAVIFDREIHVAEGVPMKSMSIEKLRTVLIIKNG